MEGEVVKPVLVGLNFSVRGRWDYGYEDYWFFHQLIACSIPISKLNLALHPTS